MASRGRPRKSVEEHVRNGTYREDRHGPLPPAADAAEPPPRKPAGLPADVAAKWDAVVPALSHLLKPAHGPMLLQLCRWLARADAIDAVISSETPGESGYTGLLQAEATATGMLLALSQRFGLTPADRAKLKVLAPPATAGTAKPKVATRPRTALDGQAPPQD